MLYLVLARDGTDPQAPERRGRCREQHLSEIAPAVEAGTVKLGGALLGDDGGMIGSALLVEAEDEREVRELLERDIYRREGVWQEYEVYPFRQAVGVDLTKPGPAGPAPSG